MNMRLIGRGLLKGILGAVVATSCLSSLVRADSAIVVNFGRHPSAEAAAQSEDQVDWLDADPADDTVCTECFAAVELQHYLRKMTGREQDFHIVDDDETLRQGEMILVGGPASNAASRGVAGRLGVDAKQLAGLGREGYHLKTATIDGRRITLVAGGSRVGTLYGCYDLLYRHGCRWFAPGELHEEVPRIDTLVELDVTERPSFQTRGFMAWQDRGNPEFLLWMARNRLNDWCIEQSDHALVRKLGIRMVCGMHDSEWLFFGPELPYPYDHLRFRGDESKPKDPYPLSDQYQGDADKDGKLSYFEAHPEWYPLVNGKRVPGVRKWSGVNFCTSNSEAVTEFVKNYVQALIDGPYRGADVIRFWTLDGGRWCSCPECKKLGTPTDRNLLLVHRLDQEVKKAHAVGRLSRLVPIRFLAYSDVAQPPTRPLPEGFDYQTCVATFYPQRRCYVHNFDEPDCLKNLHHQTHLDGWAVEPDRYYRGQLAVGEYYNWSRFRSLPICFMHTMANDIPYYYEVGARHFQYMHVTTCNWGNKALTNYQMAHQLWDVRTDCEALWQDYFAKRYGPAAETMRAFYESLEQMLCNCRELKYGLARRLRAGAANLFPNSHLRYRREPGVACDGPTLLEIVQHGKTCRQLINGTLAAELPERIRGRIKEDERMFTYGERTVQYYYECVETFRLARDGKCDEARVHLTEAQQLAEALRQDKTSAEGAFLPWPRDALAASMAEGALTHLTALLAKLEEKGAEKGGP